MSFPKYAALALLVLLGAASINARPLDVDSIDNAGRQLLAQSNDRFNFYKTSDSCKGKSSIMVCKSCTATNLSGMSLSTRDGGFSVWCFDSGDITNNVPPCAYLSIECQYRVMGVWTTGNLQVASPEMDSKATMFTLPNAEDRQTKFRNTFPVCPTA